MQGVEILVRRESALGRVSDGIQRRSWKYGHGKEGVRKFCQVVKSGMVFHGVLGPCRARLCRCLAAMAGAAGPTRTCCHDSASVDREVSA